MNTFYGWKSAPINDRLAVYDNYVIASNGQEHMTFEEFDDFWRTRSFYYVAAQY